MKCKVCGSADFTKEEGFYYCNECQTRCEELADRVLEERYTEVDKGGYKTNIVSQTATENDEDQWTTWEAYNYILKGMVDELIKLGASPNLKVIVLQLWARYLQMLKVAFMSYGLLPKLGPAFKERDAKVVYSISGKSTKRKRRSSVSSVVSSNRTSRRGKGKAKRNLARSEYSQSEASSNVSTFPSESSVDVEKIEMRKNKYMTKEAIKLEKKMMKVGSYTKIKIQTSSVSKISRIKLLGILHLGLLLCKDNIQLSDMLRWIREGHLSYYSVIHLLPSNMVLNGKDKKSFGVHNHIPSQFQVRKIAGRMVSALGIESIPMPDISSLIRRFIKELELPEDLIQFVINLWAEHPPRMQIQETEESIFDDEKKEKQITIIPNYEGRVMAMILYSLKLLFGLDGFTELELSDFAKKANKILTPHREQMEFFVWEEWVKYIEFRSSLLKRFHFPFSYTEDPEFLHLFHDPHSVIPPLPSSQRFYQYLKFSESFSNKGDNKSNFKPEWSRYMSKELDEMISNEILLPNAQLSTNFKPSLTPNFSYFKELHGNKALRKIWSAQVGGVPCKQLFNTSFSGTSLSFILNHKMCVKDLNEKGVSVSVIKESAYSVGDVNFENPVTQSKATVGKNELIKLMFTDDEVSSGKEKIRWFETFNRADLPLNMNRKNKCASSVKDGCENLLLKNKKSTDSMKKKRKKSKKNKDTAESLEDDSVKSLKLFLPHRKLWMLYGSINTMTDTQFYYFSQKFPSSFQWLLHLCSTMLEMDEDFLYSELVKVELVYKWSSNNFMLKKGPENSCENWRIAVAKMTW